MDELVSLCRYGRPRISFMNEGWLCTVEMHVSSQGASFEIRSDMKCNTPLDAVNQVHDRIIETLKIYGVSSDIKGLK